MMTHSVIPKLQSEFHLPPIVHRTLVTAGIGESFLAERIKDFESTLPDNIKLAYLPNYGMVKLRLSTRGNQPKMVAELEAEFDMLKQQIADVLVVDEDKTMSQVVADMLLAGGKTLSTAESCTGGYIAHLLTSIPGSSGYYMGGAVTYANVLKQKLIGVNPKTLEKYGAASKETVREMAEGILKETGSDYALATSGVMGPDGGTAEKPVGMVWVALAGKEETTTHQFQFRYDRMRNIELTANYALNALRRYIQG